MSLEHVPHVAMAIHNALLEMIAARYVLTIVSCVIYQTRVVSVLINIATQVGFVCQFALCIALFALHPPCALYVVMDMKFKEEFA